jgi:hypothetical protein
MIGSTVAVYNGKVFNLVDVKAEMVGYYLGEFSITYRLAYIYTFICMFENFCYYVYENTFVYVYFICN